MTTATRLALAACMTLAPALTWTALTQAATTNGPAPILWCCANRDRLAQRLPTPGVPGAPAATVQEGREAGRRRRRRRAVSRLRTLWSGMRRARVTTVVPPALPPQGVATAHLLIDGMRCAACMQTIEEGLRALHGVTEARVSFSGARAVVRWLPADTDLPAITAAVADLGFTARSYDPTVTHDPMRAVHDAWLLRLGVAGFGALATMFVAEPLYYATAPTGADAIYGQALRVLGAAVGTATGLYAGMPFFAGALASLKEKRLGMDALVSLGAIATWAASAWGLMSSGPVYFDALTMLVFFLVGGRYAEAAMRRRAYDAMERLLGVQPTTCRVWRGDTLVDVAVAELAAGMEVELAPGEQAPADGVVLRGRTHVDEAMLTGESRPVPKAPGDTVLGGTLNLDGAARIRLERVGPDAARAQLESLVRESARGRTPMQALADRAGHVGTLAVAALAGLTALGWALVAPAHAVSAAVAVLVVTCPCALGLATPAARALALARALGLGVLVKRGEALEALANARHVVFDKTGTLTAGTPAVVAVLGEPGTLALAARLEAGSEHPLGRAIVAAGRQAGVSAVEPCQDFLAVPGQGVQGAVDGVCVRVGRREWVAAGPMPAWAANVEQRASRGQTLCWVAMCAAPTSASDDHRLVGCIALADPVRPGAAGTVARLRALGLEVSMLSGDRAMAAMAVAADVGIGEVRADMTPAGKRSAIAELEAKFGRGRVVMVGDGLNDAPALASAGVGVAVGHTGMDLAVVAADAVLMGGDIDRLPALFALARRMTRVIHTNFGLSAGYNAIAVPLAVAGLVSPLIAAVMMPASSLLVLASAMRLARPASNEQAGS